MNVSNSQIPTCGPTPFEELNDVLAELVSAVKRILDHDFVGCYLQGSFALGAGDMASDCDFLVVTSELVTPHQEVELRAFHAELPARDGFWNRHLEGSYAPADDLKTLSGLERDWLYIDHGWREMQWNEHCNSAVVRWILREHGISLAGPPARDVVDAVPKGVLKQKMRREIPTFVSDLLSWITFDIAWAQRYAVESLCRMWFTFETEKVTSKSDSVRWAIERLDNHWHPLLQNALDDRLLGFNTDQRPAKHYVDETYQFGDYVTGVIHDSPSTPPRVTS